MAVIAVEQLVFWQRTSFLAVPSEADNSLITLSSSDTLRFGQALMGAFSYDGALGLTFSECPANPITLPGNSDPPFPPVWPFPWNTSLIYGRENLNQLLPMTRHDDIRIDGFVSLKGVRVNLTGAALTLTAKWNVLDAASVFTCTIGDGITVTNAAQGEITILIASAKTAALPYRLVRLVYDLQLLDAAGERHTVAQGILLIRPDVTRT